jgi:hypothetical protein
MGSRLRELVSLPTAAPARAAFDLIVGRGHTFGMKTAVSIPDKIFQDAERLARLTRRSRSQLFSDALKEYLARHGADEVTETMDRLCTELGVEPDAFVSASARRLLRRVEW